jgi:Abnormal spindle-like microcephaly-assoc'd, ASPM-SPD-2-Hydin
LFGVSTGLKGDIFLGSSAVSILNLDPLFVNISDPDGPDNTWGTADDGLKISAGSPAIGSVRDPRITDPENFLLKDMADVDLDGNRTELMPVDMAGVARVQDGFVEMGAYEFGDALSAPEISVFEEKGGELQNGKSSSFGAVAIRSSQKKVFIIRNIGQNSLTNLAYSITGSKAFTLKKSVIKSLEQGTETKLTVTFKPTRKGSGNAKLLIVSNDTDENPFAVRLSGNGIVKRKKNQPNHFVSVAMSSFKPTLLGGVGLDNVKVTTTKIAAGYKYLVLTVRKSPESGDADPVVEVSSNLLDWSSGPEHTTTLLSDSMTLRVRDNTPLSQGGKRYIRVK